MLYVHRLFVFYGILRLHSVDLLHELALEVRSLVLVDDGALSQFVDDGNHLRQSFGSGVLIFQSAEITQSVAHGLGIVTILDSSFIV